MWEVLRGGWWVLVGVVAERWSKGGGCVGKEVAVVCLICVSEGGGDRGVRPAVFAVPNHFFL